MTTSQASALEWSGQAAADSVNIAVAPGPVPADAIVTHNGLEWVWASPCSGGCSTALPSNQAGWRYATDAEWAARPPFTAFLNGLSPSTFSCTYPACKCASSWFDSRWAHCDVVDARNGQVTSRPNNSWWESWFVRGEQAPPDRDGDTIPDDADNCPDTPNSDQADADGDGSGDACDACPSDPANDSDGDGVCGDVDNCPDDANPDQRDSDGDGPGDACDVCPHDPANDGDGDGVCGDVDNCPDDANPDQSDSDSDGRGDVCDVCPYDPEDDADGDGLCGDVDACPGTAVPESVPSERLGTNRFALVDGDREFDTSAPNGQGPGRAFTLDDTAGCSCAQIIAASGLGHGHEKFGCSISAMEDWIAGLGD